MSHQTTTERLKAIQRRLGVDDDGILGPETLSRIESVLDEAIGPPETLPDHSLVVSRRGLDQLVAFEISSEAYYRRRLSRPIWPGGESGVTIGIGYDLGYSPRTEIGKDWKGKISDEELEDLMGVAGIRREPARAALASVEHVTIPLQSAKDVFYTSTLPKYARLTRKAYPGVEELPADAQAMLLSLVYNRGTRMSGSSRREMKEIQPLVEGKDLDGIAEQITSMKRLWDEAKLRGLHLRRDKEAQIIAEAREEYEPSELIMV